MEPTAEESAQLIRSLTPWSPRLALVLGSGFGGLAHQITDSARIEYGKLLGSAPAMAPGHAGVLHAGLLNRIPILICEGRLHYYQGYSAFQVTQFMRIFKEMGVQKVILTNAAGGIRSDLIPGRFMGIEDHINLMGFNPLRPKDPSGPILFADATAVYDVEGRQKLSQAALECGISLSSGIYLAVSGPSYETPAEIRAFERLGADAVGMSTVPEAITAHSLGMKVTGLSLITNHAAGRSTKAISHQEVLLQAERSRSEAVRLLGVFIERWVPEFRN